MKHPLTTLKPTMITSDFTLDIYASVKRRAANDQRSSSNKKWIIYPSRSKMPRQLARLNVPEASWHYVYDAAEKLADRIHARERGKVGLDNGFVVSTKFGIIMERSPNFENIYIAEYTRRYIEEGRKAEGRYKSQDRRRKSSDLAGIPPLLHEPVRAIWRNLGWAALE